ncbi:MAG: glycogen/starch synthase [Candidatus Omnitrophica bacterium]|nr:glycogen/starch synthase [Candidatus Omnitrophota bacterium]
MKILFLSSEVVPFAKTGGLADVAGALPIALEDCGHEVRVIMPKYGCVKASGDSALLGKAINVRFIVNDKLYGREGIYGDKDGFDHPDNLDRFAYYCLKALEMVKEDGFRPDIIHCNDWQTGLVPVYLKSVYRDDPFFARTKTVFTIHNIAYNGVFDACQWHKTGLDKSLFNIDGLEYYGKFSLLKGGLMFSDIITTVSPTYAKEIQTGEYGCGMEGILQFRSSCLFGVLNGIDYDIWDPRRDRHIYKNYSSDNLELKYDNKRMLIEELGLDMNLGMPLIGTVGRLAYQKGYDILADIIPDMCGLGAGFVLLGSGELKYHNILSDIAKKLEKKVSINLAFDAVLAQKIYAACDIFLMPSRYEPCGLGQLISFRYSTVPVVRKTGGLADTVYEYDPDTEKGNGFVFADSTPGQLLEAVSRAVKVYNDRQRWMRLIKKIADYDFSWSASAHEYIRIYKKAAGVCD